MKPRLAYTRASALVIVLTFVAILTLLIVSVLVMVSFETRVAANSLENQRADAFARMGLDEVAEKLASIPLDKHWAAGPGRIRAWNGSSWDAINLYSEGNGTEQVNLNARLPDGNYPIIPVNDEFPSAPVMNVKWKYVLGDGRVVDTPPATGVVGRFAYWTDVENGRANINTAGFGMTEFNHALEPFVANLLGNEAPGSVDFLTPYQQNVWARNPWATDAVTSDASGNLTFSSLDRSTAQSRTLQNLTGHPSSVDLSFLDNITEEESFNTFRYAGSYFLRVDAKNASLKSALAGSSPDFWISQNPDMSIRFFDSPDDWKLIVGEEKFQRNKAYVTTRGRSPEINPWGLPKLALSLSPRDGNVLNVLTEDYQRNFPNTLRGDEDSRTSQIPAVRNNSGNDPGRKILRDLTTPNVFQGQFTRTSLQGVLSTLKTTMETPVPEYASLASKWGAGETEQVAVEILHFFDQTLNGFSGEYPSYVRFWNEPADPPMTPLLIGFDATKKFYGGRLLPQAGNSTTRRIGTGGAFLISEVGAQIETRSFTIPQTLGSSPTPAAILGASGPPYPQPIPPDPPLIPPYSVQSPTNFNVSGTTTAGAVWAFILRKPLTNEATGNVPSNRDRWVRVTIRGELMCPPNWGLKQKLNLNMGLRTYLPDVVLDYSTDDPTYPVGTNTGSLRGYFASRRDANTSSSFMVPSSGSFVMRPPSPMPALSNLSPSYLEMLRITDGGVLIGPFRPGSVVSFKLKLRLMSSNQMWGGSAPQPGTTMLLWHAIPGIFEDYPIADVVDRSSTADKSQDEMLEFEINNLDVDSVAIQTISREVDDPRVARRKRDWKLASGHTFGAENSIYTGNSDNKASDLAMPNALLQQVRGLLRSRAVQGAWGDMTSSVERQNASKILGLPGVGHLASIPTGVDAGIPWQTMKFHANADPTPDWLLWNMFYVPFDRSVANQTDGKININAELYPFGITRTKPLAALLGNRVSNAATVATNIANRTLGSGAAPLVGPPDVYIYSGQVAQIAGVAGSGTSEYEKERVTRGIADIVTTQCSDYRVFIVAQAVRQTPQGKIIPVATQRVEAVLSRVPDEGGRGRNQTYAGRGYQFGENNALFLPANVYERGSYVANPSNATPLDLNIGTTLASKGRSFMGADTRPNTADDWLVPQKIEISSYRNIR